MHYPCQAVWSKGIEPLRLNYSFIVGALLQAQGKATQRHIPFCPFPSRTSSGPRDAGSSWLREWCIEGTLWRAWSLRC